MATSAPTANVELILKKFKLFDSFDLIIDETKILNGKPNPEIYLTVVKHLMVRKHNCIVFEDSISGIQSATSAGLTTIGVTTSQESDELIRAGAHSTIVDFSELSLESVLELINNPGI